MTEGHKDAWAGMLLGLMFLALRGGGLLEAVWKQNLYKRRP
jgi:hypothetical protein